jgi:hypothetical protein
MTRRDDPRLLLTVAAHTRKPAGRVVAMTWVSAPVDYEVSCECGAQWRVRLEQDDDAMATCLAGHCGVRRV